MLSDAFFFPRFTDLRETPSSDSTSSSVRVLSYNVLGPRDSLDPNCAVSWSSPSSFWQPESLRHGSLSIVTVSR